MHKQMAKLILIWLDWHCRHTHEYNGVHTLKPTAQDRLHLDYKLENDTKSSTKTMGQDRIHSFIFKKGGKGGGERKRMTSDRSPRERG